MLASVASQAAFALENAQLHEAAMRQQQFEYDLQLAHKVQQGFLPSAPPRLEGYDFFDFYEPANQVGGDYFDYVPLPGGRLAMILADVSGKGISAALLTAKLSSEARYCLASEPTPAAALEPFERGLQRQRLGRSVRDDHHRGARPAYESGVPRQRRAYGAVLRSMDGKIEEVGADAAGVPIGVDHEYVYKQFVLELRPGDSLTLFTDGFSEAMDAKNELYGLTRLRDRLAAPAKGVQQLGALLLADVKTFVGQRSQSDDMCLVCFGRQKP